MNINVNLNLVHGLKNSLMGISLIFFISCGGDESKHKLEKTIPVSIVKIQNSEIYIPIITSGKISSQKEMKLSFKTGGIIEQIFVDEGQYVKKGEILAKINLEEINARVLQAESAYQKAARDYRRIESLYKDSVVTLEQFQDSKTGFEVAKANYDIARFNQGYSTITAPNAGQIFKKFAETNEIVRPGAPIFLFGSSSKKWKAKTNLTDRDIKKIKIGDSAKVSIDAIPKEIFKATVSEIAGTVNPYSSTFEVELTINTDNSKILSGMIGSVKIFPPSRGNFKTIPIKSLVNADKLSGEVYTLNIKDSTAKKVEVEINDIWDEMVIVEKGLEKIDNVILDGVEYVYEGAKVKVVSANKNLSGDNK